MSSVYFDPAVGGNGTTVSDDANPTTGLANGGHRTRFVPALAQVVAVAQNVVTNAQDVLASVAEAEAAAQSAINAPGTSATSTTSLAIETGSKALTIQTGKAFVVGQFVVAASAANVTNYMFGQISAYNSGTGALTVNVTLVGGSGTFSDWSIALSAPGDVTLNGTQTLTNKTINGANNTLTVDGTNAVGFRNIPQNSQSAAYTLVLSDSGKHIFHPSADTTARTFTIPANSSVAYPIGTALTFINQNGAGVVTIAITTDTMRLSPAGTTGSRTLAANGSATCVKVTATEWLISGSGLT